MPSSAADTSQASPRREFPDGVAVVIGGSGGIGSVICTSLAAAGTDVVLTYRNNEAAATAVVDAVVAMGRKAQCHRLSSEHPAEVEEFFEQVVAGHPRIHTVVNAAGTTIRVASPRAR